MEMKKDKDFFKKILDKWQQDFEKDLTEAKYCRLCGQPIQFFGTGESGFGEELARRVYQWEIQNLVHEGCAWEETRRGK